MATLSVSVSIAPTYNQKFSQLPQNPTPEPIPNPPPPTTSTLMDCPSRCQGVTGIPGIVNRLEFHTVICDYLKDRSSCPRGSNVTCWDMSQVTIMSGASMRITNCSEPSITL